MGREEAIQHLVKEHLDACSGAFPKSEAETLARLFNTAAGKTVCKVVEATEDWCKGMYGIETA